MNGSTQRLPLTMLVGFGLFIVLLGLLYWLSLVEYGQTRRKAMPVLGQIANFTLTNQDGAVTTLANLSNRVWVADIIFTRCAGSCPVMSTEMKSLQDGLPSTSRAKLVTLTTDPDFDAPDVLKKYGERYGADFQKWLFLTGAKNELAGLAAGSLKLGSTPVAPSDRQSADDLFVHSTIFVVVDKQARLRGVFQTEGQEVDWAKVKPQILAAVKQLEGN
jgi:cytochrome oxidase Cu insertion factor (SCO1/SenC/PrrC family)